MNKKIKVFNESEISEILSEKLKGWEYDGKWIRKTFKTHSWKSTLMVVNSIGHLAESAWHHPDLQVSYAFVEVKLMNHSMKGITQLDFDLAEKLMNLYCGIQKTKILLWRELQQIQDLRTSNIINNAKKP